MKAQITKIRMNVEVEIGRDNLEEMSEFVTFCMVAAGVTKMSYANKRQQDFNKELITLEGTPESILEVENTLHGDGSEETKSCIFADIEANCELVEWNFGEW